MIWKDAQVVAAAEQDMVFLAREMFWHWKINKTHIQNQEKLAKSETLHKLKIAWKTVSGRPPCFVSMPVKDSFPTPAVYCYFAPTAEGRFWKQDLLRCAQGSISSFTPTRRKERSSGFHQNCSRPPSQPRFSSLRGQLAASSEGSTKTSGCNAAGPGQPTSRRGAVMSCHGWTRLINHFQRPWKRHLPTALVSSPLRPPLRAPRSFLPAWDMALY